MKLNRRIKRSIKSNRSFYIISTLITIFACALIISASSTGTTMNHVLRGFLSDNKTEDAQFYTMDSISEDDLTVLEKDYNVVLEQSEYHDEEYDDYTLRVFKATEKMNLYEVTEGEDINSDDEVLISERFAQTNGLSIGDSMKISGNNFTIVGYMVKSDYIYMLKNLSDSYYNYAAFGLLVMNEEGFNKMDSKFSYYSVRYNSDNILDFRKKVNEDYSIISYLAATSNTRIDYTYSAGDEVLSIAMYFAPVLFIIVMLVMALILGRKVKSEQKQIGTIAALGYKKRELIKHYAIYSIIPGVIGGSIGIITGILITGPFSEIYFSDFETIPYSTNFEVVPVIISLFVPTLLYILAAAMVVNHMLKNSVVELLNGTTSDKKKKKRKLFVGSKISFITKFQIRSIFGHMSRTLIAVFAITCAGICTLIGFAIMDAMESLVDSSIDNISYNYAYYINYLSSDIPDNAEGALVMNFEPESNTTLFKMWGIDEDSIYLKFKTLSGNKVEYGKYYMTNAAAKAYGIKANDKFTFYNIATTEEYSIEISDIIDDNTSTAIYTSRENVAEFSGYDQNASNLIISNGKLSLDESTVMSTVSKDGMREAIQSVLYIYNAVGYAIIVIGFALGVMVMYLITNMIVQENRSNVSMLKVLGYHQNEINRIVLNINNILVLIGFALSIPVTIGICTVGFAQSVSTMGMYLPVNIQLQSYIISFIIIVASYGLSLFLLKRKTAKINMIESLKDNRE